MLFKRFLLLCNSLLVYYGLVKHIEFFLMFIFYLFLEAQQQYSSWEDNYEIVYWSNNCVGMWFGSNVFSNLHFQQLNQILQENYGLLLFVTPFSIHIPPWIHFFQWFKVHSSYVHMNVWVLLIISIQVFQLNFFLLKVLENPYYI